MIFTSTMPPKLRRRRQAQAARLPAGARALSFALEGMPGLIRLEAVCAYLKMQRREILIRIEAGELRWGFDIRSTGSRRREVRVARQSLFEFARLCERVRHPRGESGEFLELIDQILPPEKIVPAVVLGELPQPAIRSVEVARCFSCDSQHVLNLIRERSLLAIVPPGRQKASPLVTRASIISFLKARRIK